MNRYFPIKTNTACQLKWTWSTVRLYNGLSSSCHRVNGQILTPETFFNFHNTEKQLSDRKLMLAGEWPSGGCEYCQNLENAGGQSDRQFHGKLPDYSPPELDNDPAAINVTPRILELYLDNVCNMSCLYCWEGFSSKIYNENKKFGEFDQEGVVIKNSVERHPQYDEMLDQLWLWLDKNYMSLKRLNILGGEPFYQTQFDKMLNFVEQRTHSTLEFNVVSNLKISLDKLKSYVDQFKSLIARRKILRFDLTCSIDCFGPEQEYVRYGIDLDQWKENFEYLVSQKWLVLHINQTLSSLTLKSSPELLKYIYSFEKSIGHFFGPTTMTYDFLHPKVFGAGFFDADFEKIISSMTGSTWQNNEAVHNMIAMQQELNTHSKSPTMIKQLAVYLTELDRRRGTNWQQTFPWVAQELNNVVQ